MSDSFKCRCKKCGKEEQFFTDTEVQHGKYALQSGLTKAFMAGWDIGGDCWDCQQFQPKPYEKKASFKNQVQVNYDLSNE